MSGPANPALKLYLKIFDNGPFSYPGQKEVTDLYLTGLDNGGLWEYSLFRGSPFIFCFKPGSAVFWKRGSPDFRLGNLHNVLQGHLLTGNLLVSLKFLSEGMFFPV